ncbi:hypothetical protein CEXT_418111 [Caerostris extrusa]|uniref:Uncharacterized protein n=1 Tax=Caerostris extrusa TaxID=172846 RepID=A0AAV4R1V3_CAEEX|nr:hypothetical protein CEXT_418111 [Caerostris extrusa]
MGVFSPFYAYPIFLNILRVSICWTKIIFPATVAIAFGPESMPKTISHLFLAIYSEGGKLSSWLFFSISGVMDGYKDRQMFSPIREYEQKNK